MAMKLSATKVTEGLANLKGWKPSGENAISKHFTFTDHVAALGFVVKVATSAEVLNHHPEVNWVYNQVDITLSSHDVGGVTKRDFELAAKIDEVR